MHSCPLPKFVSGFLLFVFFSCGTVRNTTSQIGLLPLTGYRYIPENMITDTVYKVYQREEIFNSQFTASEGVKRPAFNGQWVVAVLLPATATAPLRFERAEMSGSAINVYAQTCTEAACNNNEAVLATIPKVGNARNVRFFVNGQLKNDVTP